MQSGNISLLMTGVGGLVVVVALRGTSLSCVRQPGGQSAGHRGGSSQIDRSPPVGWRGSSGIHFWNFVLVVNFEFFNQVWMWPWSQQVRVQACYDHLLTATSHSVGTPEKAAANLLGSLLRTQHQPGSTQIKSRVIYGSTVSLVWENWFLP